MWITFSNKKKINKKIGNQICNFVIKMYLLILMGRFGLEAPARLLMLIVFPITPRTTDPSLSFQRDSGPLSKTRISVLHWFGCFKPLHFKTSQILYNPTEMFFTAQRTPSRTKAKLINITI